MRLRDFLILATCGLSLFAVIAAARNRIPASQRAATTTTANPLKDLSNQDTNTMKKETAILAGGCFWGMEEILRKIPGVLDTTVGYTGGATEAPDYRQICNGDTGHAEAIRINFDSTKLSYAEVLGYFFRMHDPTTLNRQHNDVGTQYRSAIFYLDDAQKDTATRVKSEVGQSGRFKKPVVTEITQASTFYPAEEYHQKYLIKNPGGYNCHILRD